jgi:putative RNA 2'-phosphotransferase
MASQRDEPSKGRSGQKRKRRPNLSPDERLGRFLAYVLRHHPEVIGLRLDERGLAGLDALVQALRVRRKFPDVTREKIERLVVSGPTGQRFEIVGESIRARYGHSLPRAVRYEPAQPPSVLFHGTTPQRVGQILAQGLKPRERQRVHLSSDAAAAREIGLRRCPDPVILCIDTECALKAGVQFYGAGPAVWLCDGIPVQCIARAE